MTTTTTEPLTYSVSEAADALRIGLRKMHYLLATGAIPSFKIGSRRLVAAADLRAFVEQQLQEADSQPRAA